MLASTIFPFCFRCLGVSLRVFFFSFCLCVLFLHAPLPYFVVRAFVQPARFHADADDISESSFFFLRLRFHCHNNECVCCVMRCSCLLLFHAQRISAKTKTSQRHIAQLLSSPNFSFALIFGLLAPTTVI